jgi:hypothetical protein
VRTLVFIALAAVMAAAVTDAQAKRPLTPLAASRALAACFEAEGHKTHVNGVQGEAFWPGTDNWITWDMLTFGPIKSFGKMFYSRAFAAFAWSIPDSVFHADKCAKRWD